MAHTLDHEEDYPNSTNAAAKPRFTPDVTKDYDTFETDKYRLIESFSKVKVPYYRMLNKQNNQEKIVDDANLAMLMQDKNIAMSIEKGIIDPLLVTKTALKNAISVVSTIISADCVISNIRVDNGSEV